MNPQGILIAANDYTPVTHPHKTPYITVLAKIMDGDTPSSDDMSVITQAILMCPILETMDLQDVIEWINNRFDTKFTIDGR